MSTIRSAIAPTAARWRAAAAGLWIAAAAALWIAAPAHADGRVVCEIDRCRTVEIDPDVVFETLRGDEEFSYSTVRVVIDDILEVSGLVPNFQILSTPEVDNAAAMIDNDVRFLAYNPSWLRQYEGRTDAKWFLYAVMAHEIGHHLQGHTILDEGSRPPTELEADEYAGFILAGLGATRAQATALWRTFDTRGSATHPPRDARVAAVTRGYDRYVDLRGPRPASDAGDADPLADPVAGRIADPLEPPQEGDGPIVVAGRASGPGDKGGASPAPSGARERPQRMGEICEAIDLPGAGGARACVSSARGPVGGASFGIAHLFDGDWDTAWAEGVVGDGAGSVLSMEFAEPRTVTGLTFVNGVAASETSFLRNARIRELRVTASNGSVWTVETLDARGEQAAATDLFPAVTWIEAEVTKVYRGTRHPDLGVTEWRFDLAP